MGANTVAELTTQTARGRTVRRMNSAGKGPGAGMCLACSRRLLQLRRRKGKEAEQKMERKTGQSRLFGSGSEGCGSHCRARVVSRQVT